MDKKEAFEKIVEITGGSCFARSGLPSEIGLDGRFTVEQLKEIIKVMESIQ